MTLVTINPTRGCAYFTPHQWLNCRMQSKRFRIPECRRLGCGPAESCSTESKLRRRHKLLRQERCLKSVQLEHMGHSILNLSIVISLLYIGWSDVVCGHNTISMICGNTAYWVKLSGEDSYSNNIESVGLSKCPYYHLLRKWCHNNKRLSELVPHHGGKTAGIDIIWRN